MKEGYDDGYSKYHIEEMIFDKMYFKPHSVNPKYGTVIKNLTTIFNNYVENNTCEV